MLEYEAVLKRPGMVPVSGRVVDAVLDYLCASGRRQDIHFLWRPALDDPADDLVLEVAVSGGCNAIVTFNARDFRGAERFGLAVRTPLQFLRVLEEES